MNEDLTEVVVIADRSGSMHSLRQDVIGGFNNFLAEQKALPGKARLTYVQFDMQYEVIHASKDIESVEPLTDKTYIPRGSTALLDAIGRTITDVGMRLDRTKATDRPGKVIFVIFTDGQENSSHEFSLEKVKHMIEHQQTKYQWEFVYLGANQDSFAEAGAMGIPVANIYNYAASGQGVGQSYNIASSNVRSHRAKH